MDRAYKVDGGPWRHRIQLTSFKEARRFNVFNDKPVNPCTGVLLQGGFSQTVVSIYHLPTIATFGVIGRIASLIGLTSKNLYNTRASQHENYLFGDYPGSSGHRL